MVNTRAATVLVALQEKYLEALLVFRFLPWWLTRRKEVGGALTAGGKTLGLSRVCLDQLDRVTEITLTRP